MSHALLRWAALAASVAILAVPSRAEEIQSTPIEPGAETFGVQPAELDALAVVIQLWGHECDSISAARTLPDRRGYAVSCNNNQFSYTIEGRGEKVIAE